MVGFITLVLAIACIVGIFYFGVIHKKRKAILGFAATAIALIFIGGITIIPSGSTGVMTIMGQVDSTPRYSGVMYRLPAIQSVRIIEHKQRDELFEGQIWGESTDKVQVYGDAVTVTYSLSPDMIPWTVANVSDFKHPITNQLLASAVKDAMAALPSEGVTVRNQIEPLARTNLQNGVDQKYQSGAIIIHQIVIGDMNFEASFNQALAAKITAQKEYEQAQIENKRKIEAQAAENQVNTERIAAENAQKIAQAEANKQIKETNAQADADALRIRADAEAEANRKIADSITPELLEKMEMEARQEHGWVTIQGGAVIADATK